MKQGIKKTAIIGMIAIGVIVSVYIGVHTYGNCIIIEKYAQGYEKNEFGDYCRSDSRHTFAVHKASLFSLFTNLSIAESEGTVDIIIWVDLFGNIKGIGTVITTEDSTYQILLDRDFNALEQEDEDILEEFSQSIAEMKYIAHREWDI